MDLEHEKRLTAVEELVQANARRLAEVERRQSQHEELVGTVKVLDIRLENVENDVKEIKKDVKSLSLKPAKRWEDVVEKAILTVVGAVLLYILARIGF